MSRLVLLASLTLGCASALPEHGTLPRAEGDADAADDGELAVLEARLAEAQAENEALRSALASLDRDRRACEAGEETSAIDVEGGPDEGGGWAEAEAPSGGDDGSRPVLRLYGPPVVERPAMRADVAPLAGPEAPPVVVAAPPGSLGRLAVTSGDVPAIPSAPLVVVPREAAPAAPSDPGSDAYQAALRLVSDRELDRALEALADFVVAYPDHAYADNALFWRAEVLYARHEFSAAIDELESLLARYPGGNKVPDALLRLGMCWERLGDSERARTYFERVRREHPDSAAAHMASREDA